ncbi:hypothetical protein Taro_036823 [Colocasia esculenta]|uniref:Endoplasmic reticulum transmembrane protein n=1 Tax=Colocasia esculenta TaxID=4460 RepID=A0A843VYN6_COLES|nr:hypothetical protein [Colocasia esculenta]
MIQLLFTVVGAEAGVVVLLLVKTPLRRLVLLGLDRVKRGRGPVAVRTVGATVFVVFMSSLYSMAKIQRRAGGEEGLVGLNPTDQVLRSRHLLEASLMGFSLFLALVIDRMHHYIRELRVLRKGIEAVVKPNRIVDEGGKGASEGLKARDQEILELKAKIAHLESELEATQKEAKASEANAVALRKQSEGFLLEYDRLLEENQNLRGQLQSIDRRLSRSDSKKIL